MKTYNYSTHNGKHRVAATPAPRYETVPVGDKSGLVLFFGLLVAAAVVGLIIVLL